MTPRILGETHEITLRMRWIYADVLYMDTSATPDDLREAVTSSRTRHGPRSAFSAVRIRW